MPVKKESETGRNWRFLPAVKWDYADLFPAQKNLNINKQTTFNTTRKELQKGLTALIVEGRTRINKDVFGRNRGDRNSWMLVVQGNNRFSNGTQNAADGWKNKK